MSNDRYLPEHLEAGQALDAIRHARNKVMWVDFSRPGLGERVLRRVWHQLTQRRARALGRGRPSIVVSEQLIENALLLRLVDQSVRRVLDFGGFESTLPLTLAALGVEVTVLDQRRYPFVHKRLQVVQDDVLGPLVSVPADFDLVYSISTLEHVGLGGYGDPEGPGADRIAIQHLWSKVRPGGRLFFTVPAGTRSEQHGYRVYDPPALEAILPVPGAIRYFAKPGREGAWREVSGAEVALHRYDNYTADFAVEGVAVVTLSRPG
jgi:hypothetical protein